MSKVLQVGISSGKSMLENTRERLVDVMTTYEKTANQIDSIGNELKQIGNSFANVGRLIAGKGTKEVSNDKPGVGLTRGLNTPIKNNIATFRKLINRIDKATEKLDKVSAGLQHSGKDTVAERDHRSGTTKVIAAESQTTTERASVRNKMAKLQNRIHDHKLDKSEVMKGKEVSL